MESIKLVVSEILWPFPLLETLQRNYVVPRIVCAEKTNLTALIENVEIACFNFDN